MRGNLAMVDLYRGGEKFKSDPCDILAHSSRPRTNWVIYRVCDSFYHNCNLAMATDYTRYLFYRGGEKSKSDPRDILAHSSRPRTNRAIYGVCDSFTIIAIYAQQHYNGFGYTHYFFYRGGERRKTLATFQPHLYKHSRRSRTDLVTLQIVAGYRFVSRR
jgi:hypothetical protein